MAFKMKGNPMKRNFGIGSPMNKGHIDPKKVKKDAKDSAAKGYDSDAVMRAEKDVTKKQSTVAEKSDRLDRAMDYARTNRTASDESKKRSLNRAMDQVEFAREGAKDAKKKVSKMTDSSGKPKKGSGKPGPNEY